jgi:hypothetical protein
VLERGCGGQSGCGFQLFDKLPAVQRVEKVDVSRAAVNHFERQFALGHEYA